MDNAVKINYGRPMMKQLTTQANQLGNNVRFHINEDGKYIINDGTKILKPPTAAAACHFVMGMISSSKTNVN